MGNKSRRGSHNGWQTYSNEQWCSHAVIRQKRWHKSRRDCRLARRGYTKEVVPSERKRCTKEDKTHRRTRGYKRKEKLGQGSRIGEREKKQERKDERIIKTTATQKQATRNPQRYDMYSVTVKYLQGIQRSRHVRIGQQQCRAFSYPLRPRRRARKQRPTQQDQVLPPSFRSGRRRSLLLLVFILFAVIAQATVNATFTTAGVVASLTGLGINAGTVRILSSVLFGHGGPLGVLRGC